eukprot:63885-Prymnesium_polylepis.1
MVEVGVWPGCGRGVFEVWLGCGWGVVVVVGAWLGSGRAGRVLRPITIAFGMGACYLSIAPRLFGPTSARTSTLAFEEPRWKMLETLEEPR